MALRLRRTLKLLGLTVAKYCGLFVLSRYFTQHGFIIVGWHGISIANEHRWISQYFTTPQTLARRLAFLERHFEFASLDQIICQHSVGKIKPRQVALTFDDGLYDFTASAVNVLKHFNTTATLFTVSSQMTNAMAYKMALKSLLNQARSSTDDFTGDPEAERLFTLHLNRLETLPRDQQMAYLVRLGLQLGIDFQHDVNNRIWNHHTPDEIRSLVDDGFDIQVHTHTHKNVVEEPDSVYNEAAECRRILEGVTGKPATDYCYPSGLWNHAAWEPLKRAGMRSAVTCKLGPNFASTPRFALRRYIDYEEMSQLEFEALVSGFTWLCHVLFHPKRIFHPSVDCTGSPPYF